MRSQARLVLVATVLVGGALALAVFGNVFRARDPELLEPTGASAPAADTTQAVALETAAAKTWSLDDLGAPDDPLPAPVPLPAIADPTESSQAADTLAQQVLAGGPESLPALITALQASGIGIIAPGNSVVAKPAEPWQGMTMQRWEVRTAAAMVLPERGVTFTLTDLASFLVAVIPSLKGAPVEQLIVNDLRTLAESPVPTTRFFGRFIAALGRNAVSHAPYDLLEGGSPQTIQLDGVQTSLIVRRLATDILMLTVDEKNKSIKKAASLVDTLRNWIAPTVYAQGQSPCAYSERTQTIMDIAAFGSSVAWGGFEVGEMGMPGVMQRLGLGNLGNYAAFASTLLAYAQFIVTYASLEAEVSIDGQPLVRTKKPYQPGERKLLTAVVKLNTGNAQMLNCFRALLIAIGLDFSLPNNGPVKGAHVAWYGVEGFDVSAGPLHGGDEATVQFVTTASSGGTGGTGSSSENAVTNAVTGEDGTVKIGVEGRKQDHQISNDAMAVRKSAKVRLQVALKGADLFGDLQEAAGTAAGGLVALATVPLSVLMRAQWATTGHYRFAVTDWREGPGQWSGTISVVETSISGSSGEGVFGSGAHATEETETQRIDISLRDTTSEFRSGDSILATVTAKAAGTYDRLKTYAGWTRDSCGATKNRQMNNTSQEHEHGTNDGDATIHVTIQGDGTYILGATSELQIDATGRFTGQIESFGANCVVNSKSNGYDIAPSSHGLGQNVQASGMIDPRKPDILAGSKTEDLSPANVSSGSKVKHVKTTTWSLHRK